MSILSQALIDAADPGDEIHLDPGDHTLNDPLVIDKPLVIYTHAEGHSRSLKAVVHCPGIIMNDYGIRLVGFRVDCHNAEVNGVEMRYTGTLERFYVSNPGFDGVNIVADVNFDPPTNANLYRLDRVSCVHTGRHGFFMDGGDVNVGLSKQLNATHCGGHGIADLGFLGSKYETCHTANTGLAAYKTDNPNARHVFDDCYSEGDGSPMSEFSPLTVIVGGLHGAGFMGGIYIGDSGLSGHHVKSDGNPKLQLNQYPNRVIDLIAEGDHPHGIQLAYWHAVSGTVQTRHASVDSRVTTMLTTNLTKLIDDATGEPIPPGEIILPRSYWVPAGNGRYKKVVT